MAFEGLEARSLMAGFQFVDPIVASGTVSGEYQGPGQDMHPPQTQSATWDGSGKLSPPNPQGGDQLVASSHGNFGSAGIDVVNHAPMLAISNSVSLSTWSGKASAKIGSGVGQDTPIKVTIIPTGNESFGDLVRVILVANSASALGSPEKPVVNNSFSVRYQEPLATSFTTLSAGVFPPGGSPITETKTFNAMVGDEFQLRYVAQASTASGRVNTGYSLGLIMTAIKLEPKLVVADESAVKPDAQGRFWITNDGSGKPQMPKMTFKMDDVPATLPKNIPVTWTTTVKLAAGASPGGRAVDGGTFTETAGLTYTPNFKKGGVDVVAGGDIDVTAKFTFKGKTYTVSSETKPETKNLKVLGKNPSASQVNAFIASNPPSQWPTGTKYNSATVLRQIASQESQRQQFTADGYPKWNVGKSGGGDGGVGIMMLTPPPKVPEDVWNWQENLKDGIKRFGEKLMAAQSYASDTQGRSEFKKAVERYNAGRNPKVTVTVPQLAADEKVLFAIRYYNGAAGTDSIGRPFRHEYELALGPVGLLAVTLEIGRKDRGTAKWVRVDASKRPSSPGEPDYVNKVLKQPAN